MQDTILIPAHALEQALVLRRQADEINKKIRELLLGTATPDKRHAPKSEETKKKMSEGIKRYWALKRAGMTAKP